MKVGEFVLSASSLVQAEDLSKSRLNKEAELHKEEIETLKEQNRKEILLAKQTYLIASFADIEQYVQELNENLISSTTDAERDMVDQRNQQFQTVLLAATIMLVALICVLIQGYLPEKASAVVIIVFAVCNAVSLVALTFCIILCVEMTSRITRFMYNRSRKNMTLINKALDGTREMMDIFHAGENIPAITTELNVGPNFSVEDLNAKTSSLTKNTSLGNRAFKELREDTLDEQWRKHEAVIHNDLRRREKINEHLEELLITEDLSNDGRRAPFEDFWKNHVQSSGALTIVLFYVGTSFMLVSIGTYMWAVFKINYYSPMSAYISVAVIGMTLIFCLSLSLYLRLFDPKIQELNNYNEMENALIGRSYLDRMLRVGVNWVKVGNTKKNDDPDVR